MVAVVLVVLVGITILALAGILDRVGILGPAGTLVDQTGILVASIIVTIIKGRIYGN